jgi:hypothetical protein
MSAWSGCPVQNGYTDGFKFHADACSMRMRAQLHLPVLHPLHGDAIPHFPASGHRNELQQMMSIRKQASVSFEVLCDVHVSIVGEW